MNKNKATRNIPKKQVKRFAEAKKSLEKMQEEIAPFLRPKTVKNFSTVGTWRKA